MKEVEQILLELYIGDKIYEKREDLESELEKLESKDTFYATIEYKGHKHRIENGNKIYEIIADNSEEFKNLKDSERAAYRFNVYSDKASRSESRRTTSAVIISLLITVAIIVVFNIFVSGSIILKIILSIIGGLVILGGAYSLFSKMLTKRNYSEKDYITDQRMCEDYLETVRDYNIKSEGGYKNVTSLNGYSAYDNAKNRMIEANTKMLVATKYKADYEDLHNQFKESLKGIKEWRNKREVAIQNVKNSIKDVDKIRDLYLSKVEAMPPAYVSDRDTVTKLLILVLNKRADTVKELVNLYETEEWREKVIDRLDRQYEITYQAAVATLDALATINATLGGILGSVNNIKPVTNIKLDTVTKVDVKTEIKN